VSRLSYETRSYGVFRKSVNKCYERGSKGLDMGIKFNRTNLGVLPLVEHQVPTTRRYITEAS
jgi:hypothetical protein